ncbi:RNA polymerase sigma factor [Sphingosinicella rhizophila]|uniref:Sigma-70 family RNA polymerase sigma factor n=1 Tax=Sphingosinicella rhizophila TaxID=3050082 RepID=A0ABU3QBH4_9SPHN|nr:sigma-70 family RNA polymerase sigma factor [Sphingosinicella sp. GR2756]MDT9600499.1 sigma-70 family RNA polymerase sigma factor [Sphingosinicella sp. GR2756]
MTVEQDDHYLEATKDHGAILARLARVFEANPDLRRDLLQDMHVALWRSLARFDHRCALSTWVYRVGYNVAASHAARERRIQPGIALDENLPAASVAAAIEVSDGLERLYEIVRQLEPPDRQIMLMYLEGADARLIAEEVNLQSGAVATRIHRFKAALTQKFQEPADVQRP